jgi:hypothetical protein
VLRPFGFQPAGDRLGDGISDRRRAFINRDGQPRIIRKRAASLNRNVRISAGSLSAPDRPFTARAGS